MNRRGLLYVVILALFASALAAGSAMVYANRVARQAEARANAESSESDRRWCALLVDLDGAYASATPQTELGKRIAAAIHELRTGFGC